VARLAFSEHLGAGVRVAVDRHKAGVRRLRRSLGKELPDGDLASEADRENQCGEDEKPSPAHSIPARPMHQCIHVPLRSIAPAHDRPEASRCQISHGCLAAILISSLDHCQGTWRPGGHRLHRQREWGVKLMPTDTPESPPERPEHIPAMQRLLDNPFALLFIGITVPAVFYLLWGLMEITHIPLAR
jgi:hypothetical protein